MTEPMSAADKARRLAAELENCWRDSRSLGMHPVADAIEFARQVLVALAKTRLNVEIKQPKRTDDLDTASTP